MKATAFYDEAEIKKDMQKVSNQNIVLVDSS